MPLKEDIANNIKAVWSGVGGLAEIGLFIKATLFRSKKIDTDTIALESYGTIIRQLRDDLNQTTSQLREVIWQNQETLDKLDKVLKENHEFKLKIERLESEKYALFEQNDSLKKYLHDFRKEKLQAQNDLK